MTRVAKNQVIPFTMPLLANSPMIFLSDVKCSTGSIANGSWILCNTFNHSYRDKTMIEQVSDLVKCVFYAIELTFRISPAVALVDEIIPTAIAGPIATVRVKRTRNHGLIFQSKNPSITNCPANVPVIVEL